MILIDSSIWIAFFHDRAPHSDALAELIENDQAAICGPIITELFRGIRLEKQRQQLQSLLQGLHLLAQPNLLWEEAGIIGALAAKKGVTIKSFDLLIAAYALAADVEIFTADKDFRLLQKAGIPIRLYA